MYVCVLCVHREQYDTISRTPTYRNAEEGSIEKWAHFTQTRKCEGRVKKKFIV